MLSSVTPEFIAKVNDVETLKKLCVGILKQRDKFGREKGEIEEKLKEVETRANQLQEDFAGLLHLKEKEKLEAFEQAQKIKTLNEKIEGIENGGLEEENKSLQEMVKGLLQSKAEFENKMFELREAHQSLQKEKQNLEEMVASLLQGKTKSELELAEANAKRDEAEKERAVAKARNKEFVKAVKMMQGEINRLREQVAKNNTGDSQKPDTEESKLEMPDRDCDKTELERQHNLIEDLTRECERLKSELASLKMNEAGLNSSDEIKRELAMTEAELNKYKQEALISAKKLEEQSLLLSAIMKEKEELQKKKCESEFQGQLRGDGVGIEIEELGRQNKLLKEQIAVTLGEKRSVIEKLERLKSEMEDKEKIIEKMKVEKQEFDEERSNSVRKVSALEAKCQQLQDEANSKRIERQNEIDALTTELTNLKGQMESEKATISAALEQEHAQKIESLRKKFEIEIQKIEQEKVSLEQNLTAANNEKFVLESKLQLAEHNLSVSQENAKQVEASHSTTSFQIEQLKSNVQELLSKNARIYAQLTENQETTDKAVTRAEELETRNQLLEEQLTTFATISEENATLKKEKEKLETMIRTNHSLSESLEKRDQDCARLQAELDTISSLKYEIETKAKSLENDLTKARQDYAELQKENSELRPLIAKVDQLTKAAAELSDTKIMLDNLSLQLKETLAQLSATKTQLQESEHRCQLKDIEIQESQNMVTETTKALSKKDKMIVKLKTLLQRAVNSDERKDQQIAALQSELKNITERIGGFHGDANVEAIVKLENENRALQQKLDEAQPSAELREKNERLTKMLEKSNALYAQVMSQNKELMERIGKSVSLRLCRIDGVTLRPNKEVEQRQMKEKRREDVVLAGAYLKSTLIQFFAQDAKGRGDLIPLILELVGCNEQQIQAAKRQWERSNQLIQRTSGFFG